MTHDERLAAVLDDVTRQQQLGRQPDFELLARNHPDLIAELRQLINVAKIAQQFGSASRSSTMTHQQSGAPSTSDLVLPRTFDGYELLEEVGRGAMGVVYKAWDADLKRYVALKVLLRGEHASPADLARFRSEAQAAAGLSHPNIVPVFRVGESHGKAYFCMKFIEGPTLAAKVRQGPLSLREAARIVAQIARAVDHAHKNGVLHRDLKPSNVVLDDDDQPLVTDFGLAKSTQREPAGRLPRARLSALQVTWPRNKRQENQRALAQ